MADMIPDLTGYTSSADQIRANHEQYKDLYIDADKDLISQETFLNLLVAEMSNQDPLEPTTNTEFISQLATFSSMQYMQDSSKYAMANYASSLVGKIATGSKMDGADLVMKTGTVDKVVKTGDTFTVTIDGEDFDISKITSVQAGDSASGSYSSSNLGDRIARAAMMVGMFATINTDNGPIYGFIDAISVKDGKISVLVGGENYALEDIAEVTYASVVDPENPDNTEPTEPDDSADDKVDGTEPVEPDDNTTDEVEGNEGDNSEEIEDVPDLEEP